MQVLLFENPSVPTRLWTVALQVVTSEIDEIIDFDLVAGIGIESPIVQLAVDVQIDCDRAIVAAAAVGRFQIAETAVVASVAGKLIGFADEAAGVGESTVGWAAESLVRLTAVERCVDLNAVRAVGLTVGRAAVLSDGVAAEPLGSFVAEIVAAHFDCCLRLVKGFENGFGCETQ